MRDAQPFRALICLFGALAGILSAVAAEPPKEATPGSFAAAMKPFGEKLLDVAKKYEQFGRVDDEARWAPLDCRAPNPGTVAFSASNQADTHGKKLYSLFASDHQAYVQVKANKLAPVGQTIVKESWIPEETKAPKSNEPHSRKLNAKGQYGQDLVDRFFPYVQKDGKWFKASKKAGLFVMMKFDPKTEGTDEGWVYGTVSADLKQVTSVGRVASCMECHVKAKYDREFGRASGKQ